MKERGAAPRSQCPAVSFAVRVTLLRYLRLLGQGSPAVPAFPCVPKLVFQHLLFEVSRLLLT